MLFRKKKREEETFEKIDDLVENEETLEELNFEDLKDILDKIEKFCLTVFMNTSDKELREKMLKLFGKIKLVKASKDTSMEYLLKLISGEEIPESKMDELKNMGLLEMKYSLSGQIDLSARDRKS